ncbi:hypothetical protein ACHAWF_012173 [Thalassiosira exigua]
MPTNVADDTPPPSIRTMKLAAAFSLALSTLPAASAFVAPARLPFASSSPSALSAEIRGPTEKNDVLEFGWDGTTALGGAEVDSQPARMLDEIREAGETQSEACELFNANLGESDARAKRSGGALSRPDRKTRRHLFGELVSESPGRAEGHPVQRREAAASSFFPASEKKNDGGLPPGGGGVAPPGGGGVAISPPLSPPRARQMSGDDLQFQEFLELCDEQYEYGLVEFKNGDVVNKPGENDGSAKALSYAALADFDKETTLKVRHRSSFE